PTTFEFNVHHRQTIDQNGHVIAATVLRAILSRVTTILLCTDFVLVNDLQTIVVHMHPVTELDIRYRAVITNYLLQVSVTLDTIRLFRNSVTLIGDDRPEKLLPLSVRELGLVQQL